tara:strand:- start:1240 stop:2151 length:912 start_codon:yes stop_codon:yes gene_type:complete
MAEYDNVLEALRRAEGPTYEENRKQSVIQTLVNNGMPPEEAALLVQNQPQTQIQGLNAIKQGSVPGSKTWKKPDEEDKEDPEEEGGEPETYGDDEIEEGDFINEEGFFEEKYNDVFGENDTDRVTDAIDAYNGQRSHNTGEEGYGLSQTPEVLEQQLQDAEMTKIVEALQRGEADALLGPQQEFNNSDLSLANAQVQGALPQGDQSMQPSQSPQGAEAGMSAMNPGGISQQQLMQGLQNAGQQPDPMMLERMQQARSEAMINPGIYGVGGNGFTQQPDQMGGQRGFVANGNGNMANFNRSRYQ